MEEETLNRLRERLIYQGDPFTIGALKELLVFCEKLRVEDVLIEDDDVQVRKIQGAVHQLRELREFISPPAEVAEDAPANRAEVDQSYSA